MQKYDIQGYRQNRHTEVCRQAQAFQGHYGSPTVTVSMGSQTFKTATQEKEEIIIIIIR